MTVDVYSGAWWDEFSAFFSNEDLWDNGSRSLLLKYFAKFAVRDGGRRVLDVGCGPGIGTKRLNEMGFLATGIDISPAMVESAKARQVEAYLSDCDPIPEEDETFDYVFCCTVVEWVRNPYGMIREMARVIKPGGGIVIACLGPGNLPHEDALKRLRGEPTNYNMLMPVELHRLLLDCGLKIRSMTGARSRHVSQETYAKLDWITKSYCSNLWMIGADKEGSLL
ncbi:class I SAM-dependent methyltransferase [Paenibacillus elgii]|uniref:class I SAM-dependent methyltransferase n=1 Tax=Paenibacillus elgii TaxID=189691 RepID=UPI000FD6B0E6|nr:class I SAM-dependent methyltransferase [Paenibacillus elgii]NEN82953.1 methyltransferase domain-containing protein [Paenibacillus elgii]